MLDEARFRIPIHSPCCGGCAPRERRRRGKAACGGHGFAVLGADEFATSGRHAEVFAPAHPGDSLANLRPWPKEPQWHADARTGYRNGFVDA